MKFPRFRADKHRFPEFAAPITPVNVPVSRCTAQTRETAQQRILITRTSANGDILMGTPLLAALRQQWPDAHITWMVERREYQAIDACPYIDELLLWDSRFWHKMTRRGLYPLWAVHALRLHKRLLEKHFDIFISFQPEDWPTLVRSMKAGGAETRIGIFDTFREYHNQTRTSRRARFFTDVFPYETHPPHRVDQYLLPLLPLGLCPPQSKKLVIGYTESDENEVGHYLKNVIKKPFVIVAPLAGWRSREWPQERFAQAADQIAQKTGHEIVLVSGAHPKDRAFLNAIAQKMKYCTPHLATQFGFRALAALIARAALVLSGDTGPMHLASAVDTPYVALFGPSPIERFAPLVGRGLPLARPVPCGPCHQRECPNKTPETQKLCLHLLSVDDVVNAALSLLNNKADAAPPVWAAAPFCPPPLAAPAVGSGL